MTESTNQFEVHRPRFTWKSYIFFVVAAAVLTAVAAFVGIWFEPPSIRPGEMGFWALGFGLGLVTFGTVFGSLAYVIVFLIRRMVFGLTAGTERIENLNRASDALQGALEEDFVTNLVRINFKYIDTYYLQTQLQADKSFNFALSAAVVSLVLIIFGIVLSLFGQTSSATVAGGAGILGEFISAVFFYLYNQTVAKMADYHRKLVYTQNIGLALKISDGLPVDEKTKAQTVLIQTLSNNINEYLGH